MEQDQMLSLYRSALSALEELEREYAEHADPMGALTDIDHARDATVHAGRRYGFTDEQLTRPDL